MTNDLPWASSGGGPLLAVDSALAQHWRGVLIFDAAVTGACDAARIDTGNGVVRVDTTPGRYRAWFASGPKSIDPNLALIRLVRG